MTDRPKKLEIPVYGTLLAACILLMGSTFFMKKGRAATVSDAFVPRVVVGCLIVLVSILLARAIRDRRRAAEDGLTEEERAAQRARERQAVKRFAFVTGVMAVSVCAMRMLGFVISMTFYPLCLFLGLSEKGARRWRVILPVGLLFPVVLFILYLRVFRILLPAGVLKFLT